MERTTEFPAAISLGRLLDSKPRVFLQVQTLSLIDVHGELYYLSRYSKA